MEVGKKYNKLTCLEKDKNKDSRYYLFKCDCGNIKSIIAYNVQNGATKSCGCYQKEHPSHKTYGYSHTRIDNIYKSMISRCYNQNNNRYKNYGGRGIKVCKEWLEDKKTFFDWALKNGYDSKLTIDRINVHGNYEPDNCKWSTYKEQANNKTSNVYFTLNDTTHTLSEWARITGLKVSTISRRLKVGDTGEKVLRSINNANTGR